MKTRVADRHHGNTAQPDRTRLEIHPGPSDRFAAAEHDLQVRLLQRLVHFVEPLASGFNRRAI
jgi:hypothetical protein